MAESGKKRQEVPPFLDRCYTITVPKDFKITFVGDMHLNHLAPKSRVDDYPQTGLDKLALLRRTMIERGSKYLICPGDVFHKAKQPTEFEIRVMREFQKFKEEGIRVFVIAGNHDLLQDRPDSFDRTTLGLMYISGTFEPFTEIRFKRKDSLDVVLHGVPYNTEIPYLKSYEDYNVLVGHEFFEFSLDKDSIVRSDCDLMGYNMMLLGHDHVPYDDVLVDTSFGSTRIVRPGSFMRGTSHNYNTNRMVYADTISFDGMVEVVRDTLPVKKPAEIFPASVMDKIDDKEQVRDLSKQFMELVSRLYETDDNKVSVYSVLDETEMDVDVKKCIEAYLEQYGIFRKNATAL